MDINLGDEKIVELVSPHTSDEMRERAMSKRIDAFGQLARFMQRPKPDEIVISQTEKRYEPFWFGSARARYKYDRRHRYEVPVAPEVQAATLYEHEHTVRNDRGHYFTVDAMEHCVEEVKRELMLDPTRGEERDYTRYLNFGRNEVESLDKLQVDGALVVPPEVRSSFLVRKLVQMLMKTFQADKIHEERIDVDQVVLFFRPVYAYEYYWKTRERRQIVEFDALTGEIRAEGGQIKKQVVNVLENDALFDIGSDVVGTFVPGANIAVKVGRLAARRVIR